MRAEAERREQLRGGAIEADDHKLVDRKDAQATEPVSQEGSEGGVTGRQDEPPLAHVRSHDCLLPRLGHSPGGRASASRAPDDRPSASEHGQPRRA